MISSIHTKTTREFDPLTRRTLARVVWEIPAGQCAWHRLSGGCTVCGFNAPASAKTRYTIRHKPWPHWLSRLYLGRLAKKIPDGPCVLAVFHGGSFFNTQEVPLRLQEHILRLASRFSNVRSVLVESRCEYVTSENLARIREWSGEKSLQVAVGLESANDTVRNGILNKGLALNEYRLAVDAIHGEGAFALTYVFLKPHGLTEIEAIRDCVSSVEFAFDTGSDSVSISCASVQEGATLYNLWIRGQYRPPWLWSVVEVLKQCWRIGPVRVGTFDDEPGPVDCPRNCGRCDPVFTTTLQTYRETLSGDVLSAIQPSICPCFEAWQRELRDA